MRLDHILASLEGRTVTTFSLDATYYATCLPPIMAAMLVNSMRDDSAWVKEMVEFVKSPGLPIGSGRSAEHAVESLRQRMIVLCSNRESAEGVMAMDRFNGLSEYSFRTTSIYLILRGIICEPREKLLNLFIMRYKDAVRD